MNKNEIKAQWARLWIINDRHNKWFSERCPRAGKLILWINRHMRAGAILCLVLIVVAIATCKRIHAIILIGALFCALGAGSVQAQTNIPASTEHFALLTPLPDVDIRPAPKMVAECVIAASVVIVGGIIYYNIYNLCKSKLGTNSPPNPPKNKTRSLTSSADDVYAAWIVIGHTSSRPDNPDCDCGNSVSMAYTIASGTNGPTPVFVKGIAVTSDSERGSSSDLSALLQSKYGLVVGSATNFTSNSIPVPSIPLIHVGSDGVVTLTNGSAVTYTTVLQRTTDFAHWTPVTTNIMSADIPVVLMDDSSPNDSGYYRMVIVSTNSAQ